MRILTLIIAALSFTACIHTAQAKCYDAGFTTIVKDKKEAKLLFDPHLFNDQRDGFDQKGQHVFTDYQALSRPDYLKKPGYALISNKGYNFPECEPKNYTLMAWHETHSIEHNIVSGYASFVQISGIITEIRPYEFDFDGFLSGTYGVKDSETDAYKFNNSQYTLRGKYTFSRKDHPEYWSLINNQDFGNALDYIGNLDIFVTNDPTQIFKSNP